MEIPWGIFVYGPLIEIYFMVICVTSGLKEGINVLLLRSALYVVLYEELRIYLLKTVRILNPQVEGLAQRAHKDKTHTHIIYFIYFIIILFK